MDPEVEKISQYVNIADGCGDFSTTLKKECGVLWGFRGKVKIRKTEPIPLGYR